MGLAYFNDTAILPSKTIPPAGPVRQEGKAASLCNKTYFATVNKETNVATKQNGKHSPLIHKPCLYKKLHWISHRHFYKI